VAEPIARLVAQPFERRIDLSISSSLSDVSTTTMRKIGFSLEAVVVRCGMTVDTLSFLAWEGGTGEWGSQRTFSATDRPCEAPPFSNGNVASEPIQVAEDAEPHELLLGRLDLRGRHRRRGVCARTGARSR
jgi:hypothetical protein